MLLPRLEIPQIEHLIELKPFEEKNVNAYFLQIHFINSNTHWGETI